MKLGEDMKNKVVLLFPILTALTACSFKSNPVGLDPIYEPEVLTSFEEHPCYDLFMDYGQIKALDNYTDYYCFKYISEDEYKTLEWSFGINSKSLEMSIKTLSKEKDSFDRLTVTYESGVNFKWGNFKKGYFYSKIKGEETTHLDDFEIEVRYQNLVFDYECVSINFDRTNFYEYVSYDFNGIKGIGDFYVQESITNKSSSTRSLALYLLLR